ncbi:hypothetical protein N7540_011060 [Penicillium herquei]|nr:hypothetical protein N7540_011060 [Penicillium herquei]
MCAMCGPSPQSSWSEVEANQMNAPSDPLASAAQQQPPLSLDVRARHGMFDISAQRKTFQLMSIAISSNKTALVKGLVRKSRVGLICSINYSVVLALEYQKHEILRLLLDQPQIDANDRDSQGHSPLHLAVIYDDPVAVRILLDHPRVDINCLTAAGDSALLLAAKTFDGNRARSQILRDILITPNVLIDQRDQRGRSALWHAANTGNISLIMTMYQDPRVRCGVADRDGITPQDRATQRGDRQTARLLQFLDACRTCG